ncbi:gluconate 2-dehydrogenase subunit 3 family protein [Halomonas sp. HMF6819]|uniref:gluconate 2-dehydrogenase subunit 3 family protein n=1 Tax=Halomonas sp. HMF6819 TaxID=3373085 RepID=UPI0037B01B1C
MIKDPSRRRFIKGALTSIPAVTIGSGVSLTASADEPPEQLSDYQPVFFNESEWEFVIAACDRLIPGDGPGPGALETNVPIFIDRQMEGRFGHAADWYMKGPFPENVPALFGHQIALTPRDMYRQAIPAINDYCQRQYDQSFAALDNATRDEVLTVLSQGDVEMEAMRGSYFFDMLLQNTKEGYFADPIHGGNKHMASWKFIGFPGARASYREWVDQHNVEYPLGPVSLNGERG